jgi:hypothetical protein|tara:strand:- start:3451 stop:4059 length:609 start_codon:yes stop_codon:yes gene_type:complete
MESYLAQISQLDFNNDGEIDAELKESVIDQLVIEQLLIMKAIDEDIIQSDPLLKNNLIDYMTNIISNQTILNIEYEDVEEYYKNNLDKFSQNNLYLMESDSEFINLPNDYLTKQKLRDYLGADAIINIDILEIGSEIKFIQDDQSFSVLLIDKIEGEPASLNSIFDIVNQEAIRSERERSFREYINELKKSYPVEINPILYK